MQWEWLEFGVGLAAGGAVMTAVCAMTHAAAEAELIGKYEGEVARLRALLAPPDCRCQTERDGRVFRG